MLAAHLITFSTYASHLPGDLRGWTHYRDGYQAPAQHLRDQALRRARGEPVILEENDRSIVLQAFVAVCEYRSWSLHAAHVRTQHAHLVVAGDSPPEAMMRDFKAYSARRLHEAGRFSDQSVWARRGDVRRVDERGLAAAREYVVEKQGRAMAVYGLVQQGVAISENSNKNRPPPDGGGQ